MGPYKIMPPELESVQNLGIDIYKFSDVYLFAKVLWMYLKGDNIGFRGEYKRSDSQIGIDKKIFNQETLEPIQILMTNATKKECSSRLDIHKCVKLIQKQLAIIDGRLAKEEIIQYKNKELFEIFIDKTKPQEIVYKNLNQIDEFLKNLDFFTITVIFESDHSKEIIQNVRYVSELTVSCFKKYSGGALSLEIAGKIKSLSVSENSRIAVIHFENFKNNGDKYIPFFEKGNTLIPQKYFYLNSSYIIELRF